YMGVRHNEKADAEAADTYRKLCDKYNIADTYVVNPDDPSGPDTGSYESSPANPYYPGKFAKIGSLVDNYGNDYKLRLIWSQAHAAALYRAYALKKTGIPDSDKERVVDGLHPYYYYKLSKVIICGKDGCDVYLVYLLVEAYTIQGHYQYHYRWVTDSGGGGSKTYERLEDVRLVQPNKWQRLENWIKKEYRVGDRDIALARTAIWEAAAGFESRKEWLGWLNKAFGGSAAWASGAMVPAELRPYFEEAAHRFGIPWWFLAAVAMKESGFNPTALGFDGTGSYGIMQVLPENWKKYAPQLGFDPMLDRDNPRAQIMVGAYMLASYGIHVNWEGPNWKEESLPMLVAYNAGPGNLNNQGMVEHVRKNYAEAVWSYAEQFRAPAVWPVPGYTEISSGFGMRIHPITGKSQFHNGIDIPADKGAKVISVSGGIAYVDNEPDGYGNYVVVKDATYEYYYAHLSAVSVVSGSQVTPGAKIGEVGSTGASTGPHLHFGVKLLDSDHWIDPMLILKQ
ncbi:MAG: peptidoglycan DD-metalloendopeptidase family protein, partial [Firmicutes bacterium]|nr:peptidoglycan DD-metalloendopeptidase family protein [Bacillota bacterium]